MTQTRAPVLETVGSRAVDVLLVGSNSGHLQRRLRDTLQASAAGRVALRLLALLLPPIADGVLAAKELVKARAAPSALSRSTEVTSGLAARTNFGTRPTR